MAGAVLGLGFVQTACGVNYRPQIANADVSCSIDSQSGAGLWSFSAWVEDSDGETDVAQVEVSFLDLSGTTVKVLPLQRTDHTYWSASLSDSAVGISCDDMSLYLYAFQAVDQSGEEATYNFFP